MRNILHTLSETYDYSEVMVPIFANSRPCAWKSKRTGMRAIPFEVLYDVMEFSLDNAFVKMPDGTIMRHQASGIPMGDPLSPGMTIGACAWMEKEWLDGLHFSVRRNFKMRRFMDDILIVYAANGLP